MRETRNERPKINYGPCPLYLANRKKRVELMKDHLKKLLIIQISKLETIWILAVVIVKILLNMVKP